MSLPKPTKKPKIDPEQYSDEETYEFKLRREVLKYNAWRFSLLCPKNTVFNYNELPAPPAKSVPEDTKEAQNG